MYEITGILQKVHVARYTGIELRSRTSGPPFYRESNLLRIQHPVIGKRFFTAIPRA